VSPAYGRLVEDLMVEAEGLYRRAFDGVGGLRPGVQGGIRAAGRMYREILNEVRRAGYDNLSRRAVVPLGRKLGLAVHDGYAGRRAQIERRSAVVRAARA
jgi:phytoene synthase